MTDLVCHTFVAHLVVLESSCLASRHLRTSRRKQLDESTMSETSRNEALHVLELDGEGPQPILETNISSSKSDASTHSDGKDANGGDVESSNATPNQKTPSDLPQGRQLGLASAVFLMANRIVGTGVFSTTSTILAQGGSVGMSLV